MPSEADQLRFRDALRNAANAVARLSEVPEPSLKQTGMMADAILLRCRELNVRWTTLDVAVPDAGVPARPDPRPMALPSLPLDDGELLSRRLSDLLCGCRAALDEPLWTDCAGAFASLAWPALDGPDGLLRLLPRVQAEITRRIYQAEAFGG